MKKKVMRNKIAVVTAAIMMCNQMFCAGVTIGTQSEETLRVEKAVKKLTETDEIRKRLEDAEESGKTSEYIVQAENAEAWNQVMEEKQEDIVEEENTEELKEQQMVVLELTEEEAQVLSENKGVAFVEENVLFTASAGKSKKNTSKVKPVAGKYKKALKSQFKQEDTDSREQQWYLDVVHLPKKTKGKDKIRVAVLDSGISFSTDIDVKEHVCINEENQVDNVMFADATGHGTALAGIIGAKDNGEGIRGIYPEAELYSIQVLDENNQTTLSQVIAGIYQAMEEDCRIINMSFGTQVDSELLHQAVRDAYDSGVLLVAAAGNQENGKVEYPAAYREVVAVGATDTTGNKVKHTSDGEEIEIFAPGTQIMTTGLFGGTMVTEGTSMSAAQVSGGAALLWSVDKDKDAGFIRSLLVNTTQTMEESGKSDAGLLDIQNALNQYMKLERVYQPQVLEYKQFQGDKRAEEYKGVKLVSGSWSKDNDKEMTKIATSDYKIKSEYIELMQKAAVWADKKYQRVSCLHATGNYVKSLKFLYQCADYLKRGKSVAYSVAQASKEAGLSSSGVEKDLQDGVKDILNPNRMEVDENNNKIKNSIYKGICKESNETRYFVVMGLAIHLTGDTFAHRTIVPQYTVKGTNPKKKKISKSIKSFDAKFGTEDFNDQPSHKKESDATLKEWAKKSYKYPNIICRKWNLKILKILRK